MGAGSPESGWERTHVALRRCRAPATQRDGSRGEGSWGSHAETLQEMRQAACEPSQITKLLSSSLGGKVQNSVLMFPQIHMKMVATSEYGNASRQFTPSPGPLANITLAVQFMTSSSFINPEAEAQDH